MHFRNFKILSLRCNACRRDARLTKIIFNDYITQIWLVTCFRYRSDGTRTRSLTLRNKAKLISCHRYRFSSFKPRSRFALLRRRYFKRPRPKETDRRFTIVGDNRRTHAGLSRLVVAPPSRDPGGAASGARCRSRWHPWRPRRPRVGCGDRDGDDGG